MYGEVAACIVLSRQKGVGHRTFKSLVDRFRSAAEVLRPENLEVVREEFGQTVYTALKNVSEEEFLSVERELKMLEKTDIKVITYTHPDYPLNLRHIPDPPAVLYARGNLPAGLRCVSVVGTRKPSSYGRYVVENLVRPLAKNGVCIVSGLAAGIDAMAHQVAVEEGAFTVAVLGSGVDVVYPPENRKLYDKVVEHGCVISELPPGTKPSKYTFPARNRIVAGLSFAVFVVEAPEKSGSLITANLAFEYSRVVMTVPANINLPSAAGNNRLIRDSIAVPVVSFEDIVSNLPFLVENDIKPHPDRCFSEMERQLLDYLVSPKHIDEINERFGFNPELDSVLFNLEMEGFIKGENGFYYRIG